MHSALHAGTELSQNSPVSLGSCAQWSRACWVAFVAFLLRHEDLCSCKAGVPVTSGPAVLQGISKPLLCPHSCKILRSWVPHPSLGSLLTLTHYHPHFIKRRAFAGKGFALGQQLVSLISKLYSPASPDRVGRKSWGLGLETAAETRNDRLTTGELAF